MMRPCRLKLASPVSGRPAVRRRQCRRVQRYHLRIRASEAGSGSDKGQGWNWNPFKEDRSKQDAAEKALREAMGERKDVLAQFEDGGDDDGGGDEGGDWWRWSWDDFRHGFWQFGQILLKWLAGIGRTFRAIFVFALGIFCVSMIGPTLSASWTLIKVLFRLEKAEDVYGMSATQPAGKQRSVLFSDDEDDITPTESTEADAEAEAEVTSEASPAEKRRRAPRLQEDASEKKR